MSWMSTAPPGCIQTLLDALDELSSIESQRRLWKSSGPSEVSSFTEAVEGFWDDSGLGDALEQKRDTGLGVPAETALRALSAAIDKVHGDNRAPDDVINDSLMNEVRKLAGEALQLVRPQIETSRG